MTEYSTYTGRGEIRGVYLPLSAGAYTTTTLYVMVDLVKRGVRAPLTLSSPDFVFFHPDGVYAEKWPLPLYAYSVCTLCGKLFLEEEML
jgi:hypothetical protein